MEASWSPTTRSHAGKQSKGRRLVLIASGSLSVFTVDLSTEKVDLALERLEAVSSRRNKKRESPAPPQGPKNG